MSLIHELEVLQDERGHLTKDDLRELARRLAVPQYRLQELVSFYPHFRTEPAAPISISACRDMSCHLGGGPGLAGRLASRLADVPHVRVEETSCLGCCELAPAVRVNGVPVRASDEEARVGRRGPGTGHPRRRTRAGGSTTPVVADRPVRGCRERIRRDPHGSGAGTA
jgi:formate dehydrogenase/NADH-quinone oxidoreductase subunit F